MKKYPALVFIFCLSISVKLYATNVLQSYFIEFYNSSNGVKAKIKTQITMSSDTLYIGEYGAWHEKEGWASYISDIEVRKNKKVIELKKIDRLKWLVVDNLNNHDVLNIEYSITFPYAYPNFEWPSGPRSTAAFYDEKGMVIQVESLFIYNSLNAKTKVTFKLPKDWKVSTPWDELSTNNEFGNQSLASLSKNVIVVGIFKELQIEASGFNSKLILLGYEKPNLSIIEPIYKEILKHHIRVFNNKEKGKYLMVWFPDGEWQTGEGYLDSYVVVKPQPPTERQIPFWANSMSHELFHYWLGGKISAQDWSSSQWFSEGTTELFANLSLIRNKIISEQQFFNILQKHLVLYQHFRYKWGTPYKVISLKEAGTNKSEYNAAIYDAGTVTALCMDIQIRSQTNNKKSLEDVLRILYAKSISENKKYTIDQVFEICDMLTDKNWRSFYENYINGTEFLPISAIFEKAGLDVIISQSGVHIEVRESTNQLEKEIRKSIFGID